MDHWDISNAAMVMTLLHGTKRSSDIRALISGWDMLDANTPAREQLETGVAILVGSGLAEVDSGWEVRLTEQGDQIRKSLDRWLGAREIPRLIVKLLTERQLIRASLSLPQEVYDPALEDYLGRARRREERESRRGKWWPGRFNPRQ